ncbi:DUF1223 domain-containing protein [Aestuariicoccus sp. MJ-SS9]|uniref:DUF1223 domain-containing protein n=1 Tax=Aestuariicoccus sp. MJ-SS9 TaxID=3079855 RepID=UPI00290C8F4B|nr:DUF1223 domain-containing protein [Aestuariicoccus sp. MJ-SS9]MDU8913627.1 DUF1223 domain-containing protein [Aestuariicoccus sp. MJ-SS9]
MRRLISLITGTWIALAGAAQADPSPVVVELFTSQGCSSCPSADRLLAEMAGRDDIIPLALHIDYWDYIGWKDVFARPEFTARQKGYAKAAQRRSVYTPQMVINGQHDVVGNRAMDVTDLIRKHAARPSPVTLTIRRDGDTLRVEAVAEARIGSADIHVIRYLPLQKVAIKRGENAGKTLTYSHIVSDWTVLGEWNGAGRYRGAMALKGDEPVVVLVQERRYGPILAAARLR